MITMNLCVPNFYAGLVTRSFHWFKCLSLGYLNLRERWRNYKICSRFHSTGVRNRGISLVCLLALFQISCGGGSSGSNETTTNLISAEHQTQPESVTENEQATPTILTDSNTDASTTFVSIEAELENLEDRGLIPRLDTGTTVEGTDADDNGIRDDIEAYIDFLPITETQKDASLSYARSFQQELLVDLDDEVEINLTIQNTMATMKCLQSRSPERWQDLVDAISNASLNTEERITRYMTYSEAVSRSVIRLPSGNTC